LKNNFENFSGALISIAVLFGIVLIIGLFISGGSLLVNLLLPGFITLSYIWIALNLLIFLPAGYFLKNKEVSGKSLLFSSFFLGITLWSWCLVLTFKTFGWFGVLIGVILLGIGIIPAGILAAIITQQFNVLLILLLIGVSIVIFRKAGLIYLFTPVFSDRKKYRNYKEKHYDDVIDVEYKNQD
jgi:hypothetical protein